MTEARLYLPVGPPGCGKSTLGRLYVEARIFTDDAIVSPDHFRRVVTGKVGDQSMNAWVFGTCHRIIEERFKRELPVYFDSTNVRENWRGEVVTHANHYGIPITTILFNTPVDHVRNYNKSYQRLHQGAVVPEEIMDLMIDRFKAIKAKDLPGRVVSSSGERKRLYKQINEERKAREVESW